MLLIVRGLVIRTEGVGSDVRLTVQDAGIGIQPEVAAKQCPRINISVHRIARLNRSEGRGSKDDHGNRDRYRLRLIARCWRNRRLKSCSSKLVIPVALAVRLSPGCNIRSVRARNCGHSGCEAGHGLSTMPFGSWPSASATWLKTPNTIPTINAIDFRTKRIMVSPKLFCKNAKL